MTAVAVTGIAAVAGRPDDSLETLVFRGATAALADAGLDRTDLDGVVLAASDMTDGRAITSMLTSGPAGAYLNDEINAASSPGHALALAYMQILGGAHERLLVSSWGKASEAPAGSDAAERLSADPFLERDGGLSALAASALQAQRHRLGDPERATAAARRVAARNGGVTEDAVAASPLVATPLRALEVPPGVDASFSIVLERATAGAGVRLAGVGWCADSGRVAERDLLGLPHLALAARDAFARAHVTDPATDVGVWFLHDTSPDAELLAYAPLGLCQPGEGLDLALDGDTSAVNPGGGSVRGEAPFGGPLGKVVEAVRHVRGRGVQRALAHLTTGFAGQFQTVAIVERAA